MDEILIENGTIINEGVRLEGYVLVRGERIAEVGVGAYNAANASGFSGRRIDARGKYVIPGAIDDHVHFRDPGLTAKGDMASESRAAAAGGVTSFTDMPNTLPPAISRSEIEKKMDIAAERSLINYAFYIGATENNLDEIKRLDPSGVAGVKVFMGSSTGDMLVADRRSLSAIFAESPVLVAVHCEDEGLIREAAAKYRQIYPENAPASIHPMVRSAEACYRSSAAAVELADRYGTALHIMHITTARELSLLDVKPLADKRITGEACVHHLWFSDEDYPFRGNFIKCNPAVKTAADRAALREGLRSGKLDIVATDHAPHTMEEKLRPYWDCPSGMPSMQYSLPAMLHLAAQGVFTPELVVEKMCHGPAVRYGVAERGFLRPGAYADIVIADPAGATVVSRENILSKCGWSPFEGVEFHARITHTFVNGRPVYENGAFASAMHGRPLKFLR